MRNLTLHIEDAIQERGELTEKISPERVRREDIIIGVLQLNTRIAIGFIFKGNQETRNVIRESVFCSIGEGEDLPPQEILDQIKVGIREKLGELPEATLIALESWFATKILAKDTREFREAFAQQRLASNNDWDNFYQLDLNQFNTLFRVKENDDKADLSRFYNPDSPVGQG